MIDSGIISSKFMLLKSSKLLIFVGVGVGVEFVVGIDLDVGFGVVWFGVVGRLVIGACCGWCW